MSDDIRKLAADLTAAGPAVRPFARKAVQVTAHRIKDEWRAAANRTGLGGYAADVTYETRENAAGVVAEVGPTPGDSCANHSSPLIAEALPYSPNNVVAWYSTATTWPKERWYVPWDRTGCKRRRSTPT